MDAISVSERSVTDAAGAELAEMLSKLGRQHELEAVLKAFEGHDVIGPASERLSAAREGFWHLKNRPDIAFRCGPMALSRILSVVQPDKAFHSKILTSTSTTNGICLTNVLALANDLGLDYQAARRSPGAPWIMPALVHWKLDHYAALIRQEGKYFLLKDPTFGDDIWTTQEALEQETSGFFLVARQKLPDGWRPVHDAEASKVWGRGFTSSSDPRATSEYDEMIPCGASSLGMAVASAHLLLCNLNITDTPVGYVPPVGPSVHFRVIYNQREWNQPAVFPYSNLGPKWTFNWLAFIQDDPANANSDVEWFMPGGGSSVFKGFNADRQEFAPELMSQSILRKLDSTRYELTFPDGSVNLFERPATPVMGKRRVFMTRIVDPSGNALSLNFDSNFRLTTVVDAIGQETAILYGHPSRSHLITEVRDPFGRTAAMQYDASGRLVSIRDAIQLTSAVRYQGSSDFITNLTTQYGASRFRGNFDDRFRYLELTDPLGRTERLEYIDYQPGSSAIGGSDPNRVVPTGLAVNNQFLANRNTLYWNKSAYGKRSQDAGFASAVIYHWLHWENFNTAGRVVESIKAPHENRVWLNYPGQPSPAMVGTSAKPSTVGRVMRDGTTQKSALTYNPRGRPAQYNDQLGRQTFRSYAANGIDLSEVRILQGGQQRILASMVYNDQHRPTVIRDSAGNTTSNEFNARGQLTVSINPRGEKTKLEYDERGYLLRLKGPLFSAWEDGGQNVLPHATNDMVRFGYDSVGRVNVVINSDGDTIRYSYDDLDRLTRTDYPDGTFETITFDRLDISEVRDRRGRVTRFTHDAARQLNSVMDPLGRVTRFDYCDCGALGLT